MRPFADCDARPARALRRLTTFACGLGIVLALLAGTITFMFAAASVAVRDDPVARLTAPTADP